MSKGIIDLIRHPTSFPHSVPNVGIMYKVGFGNWNTLLHTIT